MPFPRIFQVAYTTYKWNPKSPVSWSCRTELEGTASFINSTLPWLWHSLDEVDWRRWCIVVKSFLEPEWAPGRRRRISDSWPWRRSCWTFPYLLAHTASIHASTASQPAGRNFYPPEMHRGLLLRNARAKAPWPKSRTWMDAWSARLAIDACPWKRTTCCSSTEASPCNNKNSQGLK